MDTPSLRSLLQRDHRRLDELFDDLLSAFHADAREAARALWCELDARLGDHFALEEAEILPQLARVDPHEAAALRSEHDTIRGQLVELGAALDLHMLRERTARSLIEGLRDHAAREDALMYRWAESHLAEPLRARLVERLIAAWRGSGPKESGPQLRS